VSTAVHLHGDGAVHGVHLKYAAMSTMCMAGAYRQYVDEATLIEWAVVAILVYSSAVHALITSLFLLRRGEWIMGKDEVRGTVPLWSFLIFFAFHLPTWLYTWVHTEHSKHRGVPVASEVVRGWWIGGRYSDQLQRRWAAVIDLTVEFPESCRETTDEYLLVACWDGTPPPPHKIERAARVAASAAERGDVLVHCAHGRGRSTCVMVACLVRAGVYSTWRDAFDACAKRRKGIKLNKKMRDALDEWQTAYCSPGSMERSSPTFSPDMHLRRTTSLSGSSSG